MRASARLLPETKALFSTAKRIDSADAHSCVNYTNYVNVTLDFFKKRTKI